MKTNRHKKIKMKIDKLLQENASYQAQHTCVNNTAEEKNRINEYCDKNFIEPIKDIDLGTYELLKKQSD
jgi:hypothetical protein